MKLYIKTRNIFLTISIILLVISFYFIFFTGNETFGFFLLGTFASTLIIAVQSAVSVKVEESKQLIDKLKKILDYSISFAYFEHLSLDSLAMDFEETFEECKEKLELLFKANSEIANISDLKSKTKKKIDIINEKITKLQLDVHIIITNFELSNLKTKELYFIELYNILKDFDFKNLEMQIIEFGFDLDSQEFSKSDYKEIIDRKIKEYEMSVSISIYNQKLETKNRDEYKALKNDFNLLNSNLIKKTKSKR